MICGNIIDKDGANFCTVRKQFVPISCNKFNTKDEDHPACKRFVESGDFLGYCNEVSKMIAKRNAEAI